MPVHIRAYTFQLVSGTCRATFWTNAQPTANVSGGHRITVMMTTDANLNQCILRLFEPEYTSSDDSQDEPQAYLGFLQEQETHT